MKTLTKPIEITLVTTVNGFLDFNVKNAGTIRRVTIPLNIKPQGMFNIYYGDGHYVPHSKQGGLWQGKVVSCDVGSKIDFHKDIIKSITHSDVYVGESLNSEHFYTKVADKYCLCRCDAPFVKRGDDCKSELLAVDLEQAQYSRSTSRNIIYLTTCGNCNKPLTYGTGIGSFCTTGEETLKYLAEKELGRKIEFDKIITSISQIK